ncbi:hypothetical protein F4604DRAFT_1916453 [Suillus subluteus]|nr:hypothetical protein F4604DRAFT_1916453 [Suillus subluteus]
MSSVDSTYHAQLSREMRHRRDTFPHNAQYYHACAFSRLSALRRTASRSIHPSSNQSLVAFAALSSSSVVSHQSHLTSFSLVHCLPYLPTLRALSHFAFPRVPSALIIVYDFALFTFIRIFHSSTYHVDIILACPIKGYLFMSWRQLALDLEPIRHSRALFAPIINYHPHRVNILTVYQPLLAYSEDIDSNAPKRECARSSRAHYLIIEHPHAPYIAPLGRAFNLYRKVQEFIPPVTSPP